MGDMGLYILFLLKKMANKILHIFMKKIWLQRSERSGDSDANIVILVTL